MEQKNIPIYYALAQLYLQIFSRSGLANDARWITIGSKENEETGKRHGGRPVLIDENGNIIGGAVHPRMLNKPVNDPKTYKAPKSQPLTNKQVETENVDKPTNANENTPEPTQKELTHSERLTKIYNETAQADENAGGVVFRTNLFFDHSNFSTANKKLMERVNDVRQNGDPVARWASNRKIQIDGAPEYESLKKRYVSMANVMCQLSLMRRAFASEDASGKLTDEGKKSYEDVKGALNDVSGALEKVRLAMAKEELKAIPDEDFKLKFIEGHGVKRYPNSLGRGLSKTYSEYGLNFQKDIENADERTVKLLGKLYRKTAFDGYNKDRQHSAYYDPVEDAIMLTAKDDVSGWPPYGRRRFMAFAHEFGHAVASKLSSTNVGDISSLRMATTLQDEIENKKKKLPNLSPETIKMVNEAKRKRDGEYFNTPEIRRAISMDLLGRESKVFTMGIAGADITDPTVLDRVKTLAVFTDPLERIHIRDSGILGDLFSSYSPRGSSVSAFLPFLKDQLGEDNPRSWGKVAGHSWDYYTGSDSTTPQNRQTDMRAVEFFANMFAIDLLGDVKSRKLLREFLPETTAVYDNILDVVKD